MNNTPPHPLGAAAKEEEKSRNKLEEMQLSAIIEEKALKDESKIGIGGPGVVVSSPRPLDVVPMTFGFSYRWLDCSSYTHSIGRCVLRRGAKIPAKGTYKFTHAASTKIEFRIFEDEHVMSDGKKFSLGEFRLDQGLKLDYDRGSYTVKLDVHFEMNADCLLRVVAEGEAGGQRRIKDGITVNRYKALLRCDNQIEEENVDARQWIKKDLVVYCLRMIETIQKDKGDTILNQDKKNMLDKCDSAIVWAYDNPEAPLEEFKRRLVELKQFYTDITTQF